MTIQPHLAGLVLAVVLAIVIGKSLASFAIVVALGYPAGTALLISASLAQIGEFSFILAGLGVTLGILPRVGQDLLLAGALLSITVNSFAFAGAEAFTRWLTARWAARRAARVAGSS